MMRFFLYSLEKKQFNSCIIKKKIWSKSLSIKAYLMQPTQVYRTKMCGYSLTASWRRKVGRKELRVKKACPRSPSPSPSPRGTGGDEGAEINARKCLLY